MDTTKIEEKAGLLDGLTGLDDKNDGSLSERLLREAAAIKDSVLGEKTIGTWGSISFLVNQVYGPGVLVLPVALLNAGWFTVSIFNVLVGLMSVVGALMMIEAIALIKDNEKFEQRVEFSSLVLSYLPQPWANLSRVCFHTTMVLFNVCSIVLCAQGMDNLLIWIFGHTCGLEVAPHFGFQSYESEGQHAINGLYSGKVYRVGITAGYFLTSLVAMPLGFQSIADNSGLQILSFFFTTITIAIFFIQFCTVWSENGPVVRNNSVAAFESGNYSLAVTSTMMSYMFSMYMPSWINEKAAEVPIRKSLWTVTQTAIVLYLVVGVAAAVAYPYIKHRNVMQYLYENPHTNDFLRVTILVFIFTAVLPGIPINAISVRYNLYVTRLCSANWSFFWGSVFPFLFAWIFSNRESLVGIVFYFLVFCGGWVNFVLPPILYYRAREADERGERVELADDGQFADGQDQVGQFYHHAKSPRIKGLSGDEEDEDP